MFRNALISDTIESFINTQNLRAGMAKLINLVEGAIAKTLALLKTSKDDPSPAVETYLIDTYKIKELCASRFYRPVFWNIFPSLADNPIGKIEMNDNKMEYTIKRSLSAEEISNLSGRIIKEYEKYYESNAEKEDDFSLEV